MQPNAAPTVSFVVPCYKLAHLLAECVNSILGQTFGDFEILIMDDKSPDNTAEVAQSFKDSRVRYIRNDPNLGALRNYNHGISLSRGKYIWLISADDYLRVPHVLERYVALMAANPRINFTFCTGVSVLNGRESGVLDWSQYSARDEVINGHQFLQRLMDYNMVLAPAAMARRECYERLSTFPIRPIWSGVQLDLIWGGDWYLWCLFALHGDVGFFAEPMVCYREHELSMTTSVTKEALDNCFVSEIGVSWMIQRRAKEMGFADVSRKCLEAIALDYGRHLTSKPYRSAHSTITTEQFEENLCANTGDEAERRWVRIHSHAAAGDCAYLKHDTALARRHYRAALALDPGRKKERAKLALLYLGKLGEFLRNSARNMRAEPARRPQNG